jgi:hydroxymethylglutaryl-CoA synthase
MSGIVSYGAYLPYHRLQRSAIAATLGMGGAMGTRSVAAYDEDTTSIGVEAARVALRSLPDSTAIGTVFFTTAVPAYLDKTNANTIHAALDLGRSVGAFDLMGSSRSFIGAFCAGLAGGNSTLVVASDIRTGLPGGGDESAGGDGAVAFVMGTGDVVAEHLGGATATAEFLERWRTPGDAFSRVWEERFGEFAYVPLVESAVADAFASSGMTPDDVDHLVVSGLHTRACKAVAKITGVRPEAIVDDLSSQIGNPGAAQAGMVLSDVLDRATAGQVIMLVSLADGCDVIVLRTTDQLVERRSAYPLRAQLATTNDSLGYATYLTWSGFLEREPPRRPEPDRPAAPPSYQHADWKFGFVASRDANGFVHMPPSRVSMQGNEIDNMTRVRMADVRATVATFTVDRLAFSLSPPNVAVVIDFDGGGRFQCELTDVDPDAVAIGDRVEMTFRRLYTQGGVHDYFWKAKPVRS